MLKGEIAANISVSRSRRYANARSSSRRIASAVASRPKDAARRLVLDRIRDPDAALRRRLEPLRVLPRPERPLTLLLHDQRAVLERRDLARPSAASRPSAGRAPSAAIPAAVPPAPRPAASAGPAARAARARPAAGTGRTPAPASPHSIRTSRNRRHDASPLTPAAWQDRPASLVIRNMAVAPFENAFILTGPTGVRQEPARA